MLDRPNQTTVYVSERRTKKQRRKGDDKQVKQKKTSIFLFFSYVLVKMSLSKLQRVIGAVKDEARVGLAKVGGRSSSLTKLEVAIVKATANTTRRQPIG